ncbi:SRPBCC family protein [Nocardioides yefusunii]|uniref:SRPBCC family protein n=1 Tax=Nocardioides yefusunii TaxID=2500546 RepID=A0ABW1QVU4_9ACTN|nr:SRPBCC family protein [Nocardioides yefusunii]
MTRTREVLLPVGPEQAFDYFADPRNRPQWQSSLRAVVFSGDPADGFGPGTCWVDVTRPGLRPSMQTTLAVPGERWAETGRWRGFAADLVLAFAPVPTGCSVAVTFRVRAPRWLPGLGSLLTRAAVPMVVADVRRAGEILRKR